MRTVLAALGAALALAGPAHAHRQAQPGATSDDDYMREVAKAAPPRVVERATALRMQHGLAEGVRRHLVPGEFGRRHMRKALLASAALFGLVAAVPALAPAQTPAAPPGGEPAAGQPTGGGAPPAGGASGGTGNAQAAAPGAASSGAPAPGGGGQGQATSQPAGNKPAAPGAAAGEGRPPRQATRAARPAARQVSSSKESSGCARAAPSAAPPADEDASVDRYLGDARAALRRRCVGEAQEALERAETRALSGAPDADAGQNPTVDAIERAREALGHVRYSRPDLARGGRLVDQAMSEAASKAASSRPGGQPGPTSSPDGSAGPRM